MLLTFGSVSGRQSEYSDTGYCQRPSPEQLSRGTSPYREPRSSTTINRTSHNHLYRSRSPPRHSLSPNTTFYDTLRDRSYRRRSPPRHPLWPIEMVYVPSRGRPYRRKSPPHRSPSPTTTVYDTSRDRLYRGRSPPRQTRRHYDSRYSSVDRSGDRNGQSFVAIENNSHNESSNSKAIRSTHLTLLTLVR